MHPLLFGTVPSYFAMWGVAALIGVVVGSLLAIRDGQPIRRLLVGFSLFALLILGSKLLYGVESAFFPEDDYVPHEYRSAVHGFRIPGGMLLVVFALPLACKLGRLDWREYADGFVPLLALVIVCIRVGCFLTGCCFGLPTHAPWSVQFPSSSAAFFYYSMHGMSSANVSPPLHPLQLYFAATAAVLGGLSIALRRRNLRPGDVALVFFTLYFSSTIVLERLRPNYLHMNDIALLIGGGTCLTLAFVALLRGTRIAAPS